MPPIKKLKIKGLYSTNKTAFVDSTLEANKNLDFVKRLRENHTPTIQLPNEPSPSTHMMSYDKNRVYPTIVRKPGNKKLTNLGEGDKSYDYADKTKEYIEFKHPEQADWFSSNGYKEGTNVLKGLVKKYDKGTKSIETMPNRENTKLKPKAIVKSTSNKTREYINAFGPTHPGAQGFWGEALSDIPSPKGDGSFINYSQFKEHLKSPEFINNPEYNDEHKRTAYGESVFKDAQNRFYQKADQNPDKLVFNPSATEALNKPIDEFKAKHGEYIQPTDSKVVNTPEMNEQRLAINKTQQYEKGTKSIKVKGSLKQLRGRIAANKPLKLKKAALGLTDVAVPEAGNMGNVLSSGLSLAGTGASVAGPWGAVGGAILGVGAGFLQKSKQDAANRNALATNRDNKVSRAYDGVDETINQKMQVYKKGSKSLKKKPSKLIEAEHNEHIFDSKLNHKGVIKGNTHKEGGEVVEVEKGDSIFPANQKNKVDAHLKTGNKKALKKLRSKLPTDSTKKKAATGLFADAIPDPLAYNKRNKGLKVNAFPETGQPLYADNMNRNGKYGAYDQAVSGLNDGSSTYLNRGDKGNPYPYSVVKNAGGTMYKHNMDMSPLKTVNPLRDGSDLITPTPTMNPITDASAIPAGNSTDAINTNPINSNSPVDDASGINTGSVLKYANIANNVIRGLQNPKPVEQSYLNPDLLKYTDRSETIRRDSRGNQAVQNANARNLSGGITSNVRANQTAAGTTNLENQDSINEKEMSRADAIDNANIDIKNRAKEVNLNRKDAYQDTQMRQRAASENYQNAAIKEVADQAEVNERDEYARSRDTKLDNLENRRLKLINQTTKYKVNDQDEVEFNPRATTSGFGGTSTKSTTKVSTDKKGQQSSTVTTTSGDNKNSYNPLLGRLKGKRKLTR